VGHITDAVDSSARAAGLAPDDADLQLVHAFVLRQAERLDEAIDAVKAAIVRDSKRIDAYTLYGSWLVEAGRLDEAVEVLRRAVEMDSSHAVARFFLAIALDVSGFTEEALVAYRHAILLDPRNVEARFLYGMTLEQTGLIDMLRVLPSDDSGRFWPLHRVTAWRAVKATMHRAGIIGPMACPKGLRHGFGIRAATPVTMATLPEISAIFISFNSVGGPRSRPSPRLP
jgi:tetratricopeptide (TPR) repeat protein